MLDHLEAAGSACSSARDAAAPPAPVGCRDQAWSSRRCSGGWSTRPSGAATRVGVRVPCRPPAAGTGRASAGAGPPALGGENAAAPPKAPMAASAAHVSARILRGLPRACCDWGEDAERAGCLTRSDDWIARSQAEEGADVKPRRRACAGDRCRGDFGRTNLKSKGDGFGERWVVSYETTRFEISKEEVSRKPRPLLIQIQKQKTKKFLHELRPVKESLLPLAPPRGCRGAGAGGAGRGASGGRTGRLRGRPGARTSSTRPTMVCASLGRSCTPRRARPPRPRRTKRPRPRKPRTPASPRGSRCALPRRVRAIHSRPAPRTARPPRARSVAPLARARALHCGCRALLRARYAAARRR